MHAAPVVAAMRAVGVALSPQPRADNARSSRRDVGTSFADDLVLEHLYTTIAASAHINTMCRECVRLSSGVVLTSPGLVLPPTSDPSSPAPTMLWAHTRMQWSSAPSSLPPVQSAAEAISVARMQASSQQRQEYSHVLAVIAPHRVSSIHRVFHRLGFRMPTGVAVPFEEPVSSEGRDECGIEEGSGVKANGAPAVCTGAVVRAAQPQEWSLLPIQESDEHARRTRCVRAVR